MKFIHKFVAIAIFLLISNTNQQLFEMLTGEKPAEQHKKQQSGKSLFETEEDTPKKQKQNNSMFENMFMMQKNENENNSSKSLFGSEPENTNKGKSLFGETSSNEKKSSSLFDIEEKKDNRRPSKKPQQQSSLFDDINTEERKPVKKELPHIKNQQKINSVKQVNNKNQNTNKNNNSINKLKAPQQEAKPNSIKISTPIPVKNSVPQNNHSEIEVLKGKLSQLLKINIQLNDQLLKNQKIHKKDVKISNNIVNFMEKNSNSLKVLKNEIQYQKSAVKNELTGKALLLNNLDENINKNFEQLYEKIQIVQGKIKSIKAQQKNKLEELKTRMGLETLKIKNKLNVEGHAYINGKISTNSLDMGSLKIDSENVILNNENTKLILGNEVIGIKELAKNLELILSIQHKCGEDLARCKFISAEEVKGSQRKQERILREIQTLRKETEQIIGK